MDLLQIFTVITLLISSTSTRRQRFYRRFPSEVNRRNDEHDRLQENDYEKGKPYKFKYSVNDYNKNEHSHVAESDGDVVKGEYEVLLPDNRIQTVKYTADKYGYRAQVSYRIKGIDLKYS